MGLDDLLRKNKQKALRPKVSITGTVFKIVAPAVLAMGAYSAMQSGSINNSDEVALPSSSISSTASNSTSSLPSASGFSGSTSASVNSNTVKSQGVVTSGIPMDLSSLNQLTEDQIDAIIPPQGIVVYDGHGNVVSKVCRPMNEGTKNASADFTTEKQRYDKFVTAMNQFSNSVAGDPSDFYGECIVQSQKTPPKQDPCPNYNNFVALRDFYHQQYYDLTNQLQQAGNRFPQCRRVCNNIMASVDPTWNSRGVASTAGSDTAYSTSSFGGAH